MCILYTVRGFSCMWRRGLFLLTFCALNDTLHDIHTSHMSNASVHTLHMPKPNVTRVQSATEWTASVHTLHMPKPNVTRVQSATEWTASVHALHMPKPNVTRVQSATEWTASVHALHMPKPNVTRVQSATEWTASVHALHMPKPNVTRVQRATEWTASVPYITYVQTCDATPCYSCLHSLSFMLFNNLNGKIPNRENQVQKVRKSEMFEMLVFCCKLHRNLMIHKNVMLQLHGKTHTK